MKKLIKISIFSTLTILMIVGFSNTVFAIVTPTSKAIEFENSPLFGENSFSPGQSISKIIKFTNSTDINRSAYLRVAEVVNNDKLGDVISLVIKQDNIVLYNDTFSNFFNKGKVNLPQVKVGNTNTISLVATFMPESNNNYQNKVMGFGLQAILEDVEELNDNTTVIGGSGGVTVGLNNLIITNENASFPQEGFNRILISWDTNKPSTSQVIYGLLSQGPYDLDLSLPNFGYPNSTEEDSNKVINHIVNISNLNTGEYVYRVVSKASPATVSYEHRFVVFNDGSVYFYNNTEINNKEEKANILNKGVEKGVDNILNLEEKTDKKNSLLVASVGNIIGIPNNWLWFSFSLLIILILFLIFYRRKKNKKEKNNLQ